jgi:hypothetical protein
MSKLFFVATLAVLLVVVPLQASPIEEDKGNVLAPHKNKIYTIDLERKDAPAEAHPITSRTSQQLEIERF